MKTITVEQFMQDPGSYLELTRGEDQITIMRNGRPWIVLGRGSQSPVTTEEIEKHEAEIQALIDEDTHTEISGSWFD